MFAFMRNTTEDSHEIHTTLEGRSFRVTLSDAAQHALAQRATPLIAEMEFYFSCLIRLQVRFYETDDNASATR